MARCSWLIEVANSNGRNYPRVPSGLSAANPVRRCERQNRPGKTIRGGVHCGGQGTRRSLVWGIPVGLRYAPASLHPPHQAGATKKQQQLTKRGHSLLSYKGDISIKF